MKSRITGVILVLLVAAAALFSVGCSKASESYQKGILTENGFESKYLDLRFTAYEGCTMPDEEYMLQLADFGMEAVYSDVDKKTIDYAKANTFYEMMVVGPSQVANIMVMVEKVPITITKVSQYIDILKSGMDDVEELDYLFEDTTSSADLAGKSYTKLSATISGVMKQDFYVRKEGVRMISFVVTYTDDLKQEADELLAQFQKY